MSEVVTVALAERTIKKLQDGEIVQIAAYNADYVELVPKN